MPMMVSLAWQSWRRARGIALLAVVAFAVGTGSATAIFAVINGVMLRPLPYADGSRFVALYGARVTEPGQFSASTFRDLIEYQRRTTSFDAFGWFRVRNFNLTSPGEPQFVPGVAVTSSLVQNLGVRPLLGQWFTDEGGAVISSTLWRRLGSAPGIVGTAITLDDRTLTVTGVMPPEFRLPIAGSVVGRFDAEVWIALDPTGAGQNPNEGAYFAYARRKIGITLAQAQADAKRAADEIARLDPASHPSYTAEVVGLRESTYTSLRSTLLLLLGAAGLLLLLSCANVATLLLARAVARARETAIRVALGAPRRHLIARYLWEGAFISLIGAAVGVGIAIALVQLIATAGSDYIPHADEIAIDWKVLLFALVMATIASAVASVAPLWQSLRQPPSAVLTEGARASESAPVRRLLQTLVVAEIALAFTLLTGSAILVLHVRGLAHVPTGLSPDNVLTFQLTAPERTVAAKGLVPFQKRLIDALEQVPAVSSAGLANQLPLDGCCLGGTVHPEGKPPNQEGRRVAFIFVTPDYFQAMGIPLRAGRFLTEADTREDVLLAVVNRAAVNRYWPDRNPVGAYGRLNRPDGNRFQVVGVVGDIRNDGLNKVPEAELYLLASVIPVNPMSIVVRSTLPPETIVADVRRAVRTVDSTLAIHDVRSMADIVRDSLQLQRVSALIMTAFAVAALVMATLGMYGVMSYSVRRRTVEMGTRMALGAVGRDLFRLVVSGGLKTAAGGVVVGGLAVSAGVWALVRLLEIDDVSWIPFASATTVVAIVATAASYVPAWRVTGLSPLVAMRDEPGSVWSSAHTRLRRAVREVAQRVTSGDRTPALEPASLLTEFVTASREADSFTDALQRALSTVCRRLGVESAVLLERSADGRYRARIALGRFSSCEWSVPAAGFLVSRLMAYRWPLPFDPGELAQTAEWARGNRPDRVEEIATLAEADVRIAVPLRTRSEIIGILLLGTTGEGAYDETARRVLVSCADQFALMMENARLTDRVVDQEALRRDLALAAEVQKRLLPAGPPPAGLAEFAAISLPARSIGGDYYDFISVGDRRIGIALADVSGKGVAAALIMSVVQASLRIIASDETISLPTLAARMNEFLYRSTPGNKYATFFYAQLEEGDRRLRYVNAGHNPPYLVRAVKPVDGVADVQELTTGGAVVGMLPGLSYDEATIDLRSGDVLLVFTDGVTEAHNPDSEEFGEERLKALLLDVAHLPAQDISARIAAEMKQWIRDADQYDDLTFVVMKVV